LVAEDNAVNQQVIQRQLLHLDIAPDIVDDGVSALKAALSRSYDVIILDCQMPGLDGYETARRLREQSGSLAAVPIIALTANAMASDRQRALAAGMNDYLSKPVTLQTLAEMLTKWTAVLPRQ
jgi:CheY-like chemotaxis protein